MAKSGTPSQVKAKFATWGDYNWYGKCAAVVMTVCRHFGSVGNDTWAYPHARAAFEDATIASEDSREAPAGAVHYWDYYGRNSRGELGWWGHVGADMVGGGTQVLNATNHADVAYGRGVGLSSVADISKRVGKYRGWSRKFGDAFYAKIKSPATGSPAGGDAKPAARAQRVVRSSVRELNGRKAPSTISGALAGDPLEAGVEGNFDGFIRGQKVTVQGVASDVWFRGAITGRYFAAAGFTSRSTAGLKDLGSHREPARRKKRRYVRIPEPWFVFASAREARSAQRGHQGPTIPAGDYLIVDGKGPYLVAVDGKRRWIGTGRTNPPVIKK